MAGGWAGEVVSTSRSTAGQDDHHVEDDHEMIIMLTMTMRSMRRLKMMVMRTMMRRSLRATCWNIDLTRWTGCAWLPACC